jgi:hypothetical protein
MAKQARALTPEELDQVRRIDAVRREYFERDPARPASRFVKDRVRSGVHPEVVKAQARLRTARWRRENDGKKAPSLDQIGRSLAVALVTSKLAELTVAEARIVERALNDLKRREFDIDEAKATLRRLRNKLVSPADRPGEGTADGLPF